jgi:hypothetical protein
LNWERKDQLTRSGPWNVTAIWSGGGLGLEPPGELERLPDGELLRRAARALTVDVHLLCDAFLRQPEMTTKRPGVWWEMGMPA